MIKTTLLCSAICTAFMVGGRTETATPTSEPATIQEALKPLIGKQCAGFANTDSWSLNFRRDTLSRVGKSNIHTLDLVGNDFVRLTSSRGVLFLPIDSIQVIYAR